MQNSYKQLTLERYYFSFIYGLAHRHKEAFMDAKEKIILALDVNSREEALELVRIFRNFVSMFKVGLRLFVGFFCLRSSEKKKKGEKAGLFVGFLSFFFKF